MRFLISIIINECIYSDKMEAFIICCIYPLVNNLCKKL